MPDTPVNRSPRPDSGAEPTTSAISGRTSREPFAYFDPASSSWRTSQLTLDSDSTTSSPTFTEWGSMQSGALYARRTPELLTVEPVSSSSLPTPTSRDWKGGQRPTDPSQTTRARGDGGLSDLPSAVMLLPTPGANDSTGAEGETRAARQEIGKTGGPALRDLPNLLPTPTSQAAKHGSTPDLTADGHGFNLWDLPHLLPTPVANEENPGAGGRPNRGRTGEHTKPRSDDGSSRSDDPLPDQLTIGDDSSRDSWSG